MLGSDQDLYDPLFGVSVPAIKMRREVQMYQWEETIQRVGE